jgi:hypothetical protein
MPDSIRWPGAEGDAASPTSQVTANQLVAVVIRRMFYPLSLDQEYECSVSLSRGEAQGKDSPRRRALPARSPRKPAVSLL